MKKPELEMKNISTQNTKYKEEDNDITLTKTYSEEINTNASSIKGLEVPQKLRSNSSDEKIRLKAILKDAIETKNIPHSPNRLQSSTNDSQSKSIWKKFKSKVSNIKNNIKYNTLTTNSFFDFYQFLLIKIFDKVYITKDDLEDYCLDVYNIIYMSYRSEISISNYKGVGYTSDCGWGCMIRAAQMILARGIQLMHLMKVDENGNTYIINSESSQIEIILETILLFMDCYLPFEEIKENASYKGIVEKAIKQCDENESKDLDNIKSVLPPFSVQNICKVGEIFGKSAGEWFSDVNIVHIFKDLNEEFHPVENLEIFSFTEGVVYESKIKEKCFKDELMDYKRGLIFISLRIGLVNIPSEYYSPIKEIFDIPLNIGIIGGKQNNAHYFIGTAGDYLLYLDPHYNQKTVKSYQSLKKDCSSYLKKQVYQMHIKNMSPAFTIGFYFRNFDEYEFLFTNLESYSSKENALFHASKEESKKLKGNLEDYLIDFVEDNEDDF